MGKVFEAVQGWKIRYDGEQVQDKGGLPITSFGFRPGRSCADAVVTLLEWVKAQHKARKHVLLLAVDMLGAFPNVRVRVARDALHRAGFEAELMDWVFVRR